MDRQGLQDKIELVPIDLKNMPAWYKEKVYSAKKVPASEHNNRVMGESLDLIKYIDSNFERPSLAPDGLEKQAGADELISYTDSFSKAVRSTLKVDDNDAADAAFDLIGRGTMGLVFSSLVYEEESENELLRQMGAQGFDLVSLIFLYSTFYIYFCFCKFV